MTHLKPLPIEGTLMPADPDHLTAKLLRIEQGSDPTTPEPGAWLTPGQQWHAWLSMEPEQREAQIRWLLAWANYGREFGDAGRACRDGDHRGQLTRLAQDVQHLIVANDRLAADQRVMPAPDFILTAAPAPAPQREAK
jgi:hypothetical protein